MFIPFRTPLILRVTGRRMNQASRIGFAQHARSFESQRCKTSDMRPILSKKAMPPVGPYVSSPKNSCFVPTVFDADPSPKSQAIKTPHAIYCSGQLPADEAGNIVQGRMSDRTRACLQALSAVLVEAGSSLDRVVKVQIFLTNMHDFAEMNKEYERWIKHKPARSCVAVYQLPKGVDIEIECIALP